MRKIIKTSLLLTSLFSLNAFASMSNDVVKPEKVDDDVETITVVGERPIIYYRQVMQREEKQFYEMYNKLTENEDFKVHCAFTYVGDGARGESCQPQFARRLKHSLLLKERVPVMMKMGQVAVMTDRMEIRKLDEKILGPELRKLGKKQRAHVEKLVKQHPELLEQLAKFSESKAVFEAKREAHFKDHWSTKLSNWLKN